jgi:uncharacterized protein (DUF305 family)
MTTIGLASILVVGASACGSSESTSASRSASTTASADYNAADVTFAQLMVPHHQQAVEMADLALASKAGASKAVQDLATRIKNAQDPEIQMMQGWMTMWGSPMTGNSTMPMGSDQTSGTVDMAHNGMMSDADITTLAAAHGTEFDTMWLTLMISHHQGAVTMAMTEQQNGSNADATTLAGKIITAQNAEIAEMNKLLGK